MTRSYRPTDPDRYRTSVPDPDRHWASVPSPDRHRTSVPMEGSEEKPLPIDLAVALNDDPEPWQQLAPACWAAVICLAVAILGSFAILWVVYG